MALTPVPMSTPELLGVLRGMIETIEQRDSFDGSIEYHAGEGPPCASCGGAGAQPPQNCDRCFPWGSEPLPEGKDFWVHGVQRVGNSQGQGGIIFFGEPTS